VLYDNWLRAGRLDLVFQQEQRFLFQTYSPSPLSCLFFLRVNGAVFKFDSLFRSRTYVKKPLELYLYVLHPFGVGVGPRVLFTSRGIIVLLCLIIIPLEDHITSTRLCVWFLGNQFNVFDI
jgi:hypothetical protein